MTSSDLLNFFSELNCYSQQCQYWEMILIGCHSFAEKNDDLINQATAKILLQVNKQTFIRLLAAFKKAGLD